MSQETDVEEYKIVTDDDKKIQTMLNQWRHEYDLEIISFEPLGPSVSKIIVKRTKKLH